MRWKFLKEQVAYTRSGGASKASPRSRAVRVPEVFEIGDCQRPILAHFGAFRRAPSNADQAWWDVRVATGSCVAMSRIRAWNAPRECP
jgi:hypothetical protein